MALLAQVPTHFLRSILRSIKWGLTTSSSGTGQAVPRTRGNVAPDSSVLVMQAKHVSILLTPQGLHSTSGSEDSGKKLTVTPRSSLNHRNSGGVISRPKEEVLGTKME